MPTDAEPVAQGMGLADRGVPTGPASVASCGGEAEASLVAGAAAQGGFRWQNLDVFTNFGSYMPRTHCVVTGEGRTDWFWVWALVILTLGVIAAYGRIMLFWRRAYFAELPEDRNTKMYNLAQIFLWCAVCGYAMSIVMFVWPAYRLLAVFLLLLNMWSWKFALNLDGFAVSLRAKRLERELAESLTREKADLERLVAVRTQELEEASAAAQAANLAKSDYLAGISHEIRTPMTSILGYAELIRAGGQSLTEQAECAETICRNGEHLIALINNVLDMSKIEAGLLEIECLPVSPRALLEDVSSMLRHRAERQGLSLEIVCDPVVPETLQTDPVRVRQILTNLVGNAIKFTERGRVRMHASYDSGELIVKVFDTGIGIEPGQLERIFQPFRQAEVGTARRFGGTGLGLSISRNLAELLGGTLTAESQLDRGSTFTLRIQAPVTSHESIQSPAASTDQTRAESRGRRLLLVEDGPDNRRLLRYHLTRAGFDVDDATNGREAIEQSIASREEGARST